MVARTLHRLLALLALVIPLSLVVAVPDLAAGPWTQPQGHGYAKLSARWLPGLHYSDGSGNAIRIGTYHELVIGLYGELGVARYVTLTLHMPLFQLFALSDPRGGGVSAHMHTGDPTIGAVFQLLRRGRNALSFESGFTAPLVRSSKTINAYSTSEGNPLIGRLNLGAGVYDVYWGFAYGYGWDTMYISSMARYLYRSGGFDHEIHWSVE
ncbi:MAG: hypothetical protein KC609_18835, partial [Myxococcales bacterium]|nr:hypothetical protein [Myxococcales bacterium]